MLTTTARFAPIEDRYTGAGPGAEPAIVLQHGDTPIGNTTLGEIERSVRLRTWPGLVDVGFTTTVVDVSRANEAALPARISVHPTAPLADGVYSLQVGALPTGVYWQPSQLSFDLGDGSKAVRFATNSAPTLLQILACEVSSGFMLSLRFSEHVIGGATGDVQVTQPGVPDATCTLAAGSTAPTGDRSRRVECSHIDPAAPLEVVVGPAWHSATGVALTNASPGSAPYRFIPRDQPPESGDSCRVFLVPGGPVSGG